MSGMGIDEFLSHQPNQSGGGNKVLRWTKRTPPALRFWLHCEAFITPLWRHGWPRLVELDKDGSRESHIWSGHFGCWENDHLVSQQYKRTRDGGRVKPPRLCGMCLFLEHLRFRVDGGDIGWLDPVSVFDAPDDDTSTILVAAAMYNGIPKLEKLDDDQKTELKEAGVRASESWQQNTMAKCNYVLVGVDEENTAEGVQVLIENTLTGKKLRTEIRKQLKRSPKKGNPLKNPYPFLLEYFPEEKAINDKYDVTALDVDDDEGIPAEVLELIKDTEPPNIEGICKPGEPMLLRSVMEEHIVDELKDMFDWDKIFGASEKMGGDYEGDEDTDEQPDIEPGAADSSMRDWDERMSKSDSKPEPKKSKAKAKSAKKSSSNGRSAKKTQTRGRTSTTTQTDGTDQQMQDGDAPKESAPKRRRKKPEPPPEPEGPTPYDGDDGLECEMEECDFMMAPDWPKCPSCGAEYEMDDDEPAPEPTPPPKAKSKAKAKGKAAAARGK